MDKGIYSHGEGTKPKFSKTDGWGSSAFTMNMNQPFGTGIYTLDKTGSALQEAGKYIQLFNNDLPLRNASGNLQDNIDAFSRVAHAVDKTSEMTKQGEGGFDFYASGSFSRDELVNFVLDGSLPSILQNKSIVPNPVTVRKDLDIMFTGMQIINNSAGGMTGSPGPPWDNNLHEIKVGQETLDTYNFLIDIYQFFQPNADLSSYRNLPAKLAEKNH